MSPHQTTVKARWQLDSGVVATLALVIALVIGPLGLLALAALRYGVDSRPGIDDRDQRPWLVPTD